MNISIFIPVYNGERYLAETLESLLAQSHTDFTVLCVDDSSTDGSLGILDSYAARDSRIHVFSKANGGDVPHAWHFVTPLLEGDFTLYMSQDDLLKPDTLEKLAGRQQETGADCVSPSLTWYYDNVENGIMTNEPAAAPGRSSFITQRSTLPTLSGTEALDLMMDYTIPGFALWRTSIVKANPVPLAAYNSDEYAQRLWCSKCRTVAFSDAEFLYRQDNPDAITKKFTDKQLESSLTDAMLLQLAEKAGSGEECLTACANKGYETLWFHTMWFTLHRRQFGRQRRRQMRRLFSQAYRPMHRRVTLSHWKYRWSSRNLLFFWTIIYLKAFRAKLIHDAD